MHDNLRCACMRSVSIQSQKQIVGMGVSIMDKIMVILYVHKKLYSTKSAFMELWFINVTNVIYMLNKNWALNLTMSSCMKYLLISRFILPGPNVIQSIISTN